MVIKVGINGFGRIGRIVSRACFQNIDLQLSAINDPAISIEYICYLIKFDSTHGKFNGNVSYNDNEVIVNDHHIKVYHEKLPASVSWQSAGVQYVIEASGMFTSYEKAKGHLESESVKLVIVTAPSVDLPMVILGVNENKLSKDQRVISCGSSTLYCLAPIIKILEDTYGVEDGFLTSIHAMTPSLKPLDGLCLRGKHWRDYRSIHQNIIPATTGACKALGKILPQVKDKLSGLAFRVPIVNVSVLDITIRLKSATTLQEIVKTVQETNKTLLGNIIKVTSEETVSSDFIGETFSCIFDEYSSIQLKPNYFKIICWYENEYSYACRVVDTIKTFERQDQAEIGMKATHAQQQHLPQKCERSGKSMPIVGDGFGDFRPRSTPNPPGSLELSAHRPSTIKNPLATVPSIPVYRDTKKKNEIFKIWNDTNEITHPRRNRTCLMIAPSPHPKNIEGCAQERLEDVKREFSKMVNVTENLLMKSQSNQSSIRSSIEKVKGFKDNKNLAERFSSTKAESCREREKNASQALFCGDSKSLDLNDVFLTPNSNRKDESTSYHFIRSCERKLNLEKEFKQLIDTAECASESNKHYLPKNKLSSKTFSVVMTNKNSEFKQQVTKTINSLIDGLSQNIEGRALRDDSEKDFYENNYSDSSKSIHREDKISVYLISPTASNERDLIRNVHNNANWNKEKRRVTIVDNELRKRNVILMDKQILPEGENISSSRDTNAERVDQIERIDSPRNILRGVAMVSQAASKSPSNTLSTVSNFVRDNKQDIYDKLDSASGSDSDNSFQINEKKSQIIQITDLTNSLEDLARLDKICRIIEISDELSDKLFSALDDGKENILKKTKWSFKDLCDRIKLDEFCNKVFGGAHT